MFNLFFKPKLIISELISPDSNFVHESDWDYFNLSEEEKNLKILNKLKLKNLAYGNIEDYIVFYYGSKEYEADKYLNLKHISKIDFIDNDKIRIFDKNGELWCYVFLKNFTLLEIKKIKENGKLESVLKF